MLRTLTALASIGLLVAATGAASAPPAAPAAPAAKAPARPRTVTLPLLQLDDQDVTATSVRINGFDTNDLTTSRADDDGTVRGFTQRMNSYAVVPAYFLKAANNTLTTSFVPGDHQAAFACRVVVVDHDSWIDQFAAAWTTKTLVELKSAAGERHGRLTRETLSTTFAWPATATPPLPVWSWTRAGAVAKIVNDQATKDGLYKEVSAFWTLLSTLPSATPAARAALSTMLKTSTKEYAQSRALRGIREHYVDDVVTVAATLDRPGATPRAELKARALKEAAEELKRPLKVDVGPVHDGQPPINPAMYDTPHFQIVQLPPAADLVVDIFADGALARLRPREGTESLMGFRSMWRDGQWGRTGEIFVQFDVWFRKSATGAWEIDALVDRQMANVGYTNETLGELLEHP